VTCQSLTTNLVIDFFCSLLNHSAHGSDARINTCIVAFLVLILNGRGYLNEDERIHNVTFTCICKSHSFITYIYNHLQNNTCLVLE
jgi:hypothetical protein